MKKLTLIVSALAIVLGLAQCKKPNAPKWNFNYNKHTESISFSTSLGNGEKGSFTHSGIDLDYLWDAADKIYVYATTNSDKKFEGAAADETHYCGYLTLESGSGEKDATFTSDDIVMPDECTAVRFMHYGRDIKVEDGAASVDFAKQDGLLTTISNKVVAKYDDEYRPDGKYVSRELGVQFAILNLEFDKESFGIDYTGDAAIHGNFGTALSVSSNGVISTSGSTVSKLMNAIGDSKTASGYYAVIITDEVERTYTYYANHHLLDKKSTIMKDMFYSDITDPNNPKPYKIVADIHDVMPALFSIDNNVKIRFSKGNLQYLGKTSKYRFAERQYDFLGGEGFPGNVTLEGYDKYNTTNEETDAARDLFGWGCTGYQDNRENASTYQKYYHPYSTQIEEYGTDNVPNIYGYGPDYYDATKYNLTVGSHSDWGYLFGGEGSCWRTLSKDEWEYLIKDRVTNLTGNVHYALVKVDGVFGVMAFPDVFTWPSDVESKPSVFDDDLDNDEWTGAVEYNAATFKMLEDEGVVFFPCTGQRGSTVLQVTTYGLYWSSSAYTNVDEPDKSSQKAYSFAFCGSVVNIQNDVLRYLGRSVRLVR